MNVMDRAPLPARIFLWLLVLVPLLWIASSRAEIRPDDIVLVLNSYHEGYSWSDNEMTGIIETFRSFPRHFELRTEYLDTKFYPRMELFEEQKALMVRKYGGVQIPVVIVADNPAFDFALKYRPVLFPDASIVFCGINGYEPVMIAGQKRITGIAERLDTRTTVELALSLHPETEEILVIHDYTPTGLATRHDAEADLAVFASRVKIRFMENLGTDDMLRQLKGLRKGTLVLALSYSRDRNGVVYDHIRISRLLGQNSPVPVYGAHEERIGYGIIGGSLLGGNLQGSEAARIALRILQGEDAGRIPVQTKSPARIKFDYNQMVKYGISRSSLPPDAVIVNEPKSIYRDHTALVWSMIGTLTSLVLVICLLVLNIRQRGRSELAIARKAAELEQSNKELQEFNTLAYHDLQEPLRSISSFVQLLERKYRDKLDREAREYIGFAVQGVSRMKELFSDFLAYTAQTRDSSNRAAVDLDRLLVQVSKRLQDQITASGATIEIGPLPVVMGNEQQLSLLFHHLIDNAIKFRGSAPPLIRIAARREGDYHHFTISDNGIGIEQEYSEQIFRIFERLHHVDRYTGTGIGLAICRKIVVLHHGRIWVESVSGQGTTFHLTLNMIH